MTSPESGNAAEEEGPRLQAQASGQSRIHQAGRDQHIAGRDLHLHYEDRVRRIRRAASSEQEGTQEGTHEGMKACPYPGLAAFGAEQADWYFGRDELIADLLARLDERLAGGGPVMVVAPSGAGKSSLLRAGLLPALASGALPSGGSENWPRVLFTPTAHPAAALTDAVAGTIGTDPGNMAEAAADDPRAWAAMVCKALRERSDGGIRAGARLVVIVDQMEELFTVCATGRERDAFLDLLAALTHTEPGGESPAGLVVCGLRSDFYTPCADHPWLRTALQKGQLLVGPMTETELRQAILFPARAVGLEAEAGLVELLLSDLTGSAGSYEAGRLPLLAHALRATWQQRHGHILTVDGYRATGGIRHAVATSAERIFTGLDPPLRHSARTVFLRLVTIGDGVEDTRRRLVHPDPQTLGDDPESTATVIETFTEARLLTRNQDSIEITHEALLHAWPRLRHWIDTDRAGHLVHQDLQQAAIDWDRADRDPGMLYRGHRLAAARAWADRPHQDRPSPTVSAFLNTSARHAYRAVRLRRAMTAVLIVLALLASLTAALAFRQRAEARAQRDAAIFNQIMAQAERLRGTQSSIAAQLGLAAYRMRPDDPEARAQLSADAGGPLSTALTGHTGVVKSVAFSPDGRILASAGEDGTVRLWDLTDRVRPALLSQLLTGHTGIVLGVAFSPDGRILASAGEDGTVRLWDLTDRAQPALLGRPLRTRADAVVSVVFSPRGHLLATGGVEGGARLWDVTDPARPSPSGGRLPGQTETQSLAFSPDGRILAGSGVDTSMLLWTVKDPSHPKQLPDHVVTGQNEDNATAASIMFSPDGQTLAGAFTDGTTRLWKVADPARPTTLTEPLAGPSEANAVAFSPDSRTLATAGADGTIRTWECNGSEYPLQRSQPLTDHSGGVQSVVFSPDGRTLASAGTDLTVRLWTLPASVTGTAPLLATAFTPDGRTLVTAWGDGTIQWSDASAPAGPVRRKKYPWISASIPLAFAPGARALASFQDDGTVRLWDLRDPDHSALIGRIRSSEPLAFSSDGWTVAAIVDDDTVRLWSLTGPAGLRELGELHTPVRALVLSPDGRTLATANESRTVRLWDLTDPARPALLTKLSTGHLNTVSSLAFSPDGHTLATAGGERDQTVRLWDITDRAHPAQRGKPLSGQTRGVGSLAFSPDGHTLASMGDLSIWLWNTTAMTHPRRLGRPLTGTVQGFASLLFSPDGRILAAEDNGTTGLRLWDLDTDRAIRTICSATGNTLTPDLWQQYIVGLPYQPLCP